MRTGPSGHGPCNLDGLDLHQRNRPNQKRKRAIRKQAVFDRYAGAAEPHAPSDGKQQRDDQIADARPSAQRHEDHQHDQTQGKHITPETRADDILETVRIVHWLQIAGGAFHAADSSKPRRPLQGPTEGERRRAAKRRAPADAAPARGGVVTPPRARTPRGTTSPPNRFAGRGVSRDNHENTSLRPPRRRAGRGRASRIRRRNEHGRRPRHRCRRGERAFEVPPRDGLLGDVHRHGARGAADGRGHAHVRLYPRAQPDRPARPAALRPRHRDGRQVAPRAQPRPVLGPRHGRLRAGVRRRRADRPRTRPLHGHVPPGPRRDRSRRSRAARARRRTRPARAAP